MLGSLVYEGGQGSSLKRFERWFGAPYNDGGARGCWFRWWRLDELLCEGGGSMESAILTFFVID